jgi:hypothetical protein
MAFDIKENLTLLFSRTCHFCGGLLFHVWAVFLIFILLSLYICFFRGVGKKSVLVSPEKTGKEDESPSFIVFFWAVLRYTRDILKDVVVFMRYEYPCFSDAIRKKEDWQLIVSYLRSVRLRLFFFF